MTIRKTVNLVMRCSSVCPYRGKLSDEVALAEAVELAKLCLDFAEKGMTDEAMDLDSEHWKEVIVKLENKTLDYE